jgi:tetratricopeptide (TPR) repeat protein
MNRILSIITILFIFCSAPSFAATDYNQLWQKGNDFYQQKQYDSALFYYEQIAANKPANAILYYNMGNAYYRANKIGPAVLNFERALRIDPSFQHAADNLKLTQNRIANRIQSGTDLLFVQWWHDVTGGHNANAWAVISLLLFILLIALLLHRRFQRPSWLVPQVIGGVALIWIVSLIISIQAAGNDASRDRAVVMQNDTPLMTSSQQTKNQSFIPEGTTLEIISAKNSWLEVRLPDGRTGWLMEGNVTRI